MDVAADAQTLAAALNHSAFNIANALGAWTGGLAIAAGYGWTSTGWVGTSFALGGLGVFAMSLLTDGTLRDAHVPLLPNLPDDDKLAARERHDSAAIPTAMPRCCPDSRMVWPDGIFATESQVN